MKRIFMLIMISLLIFGAIPMSISAETVPGEYASKDEVIYGNLDAHGNIKNMYAVNTFDVTKPGTVIDYGNYIDVRNLTDLTDIETSENNEVQLEVGEEEFYYQGELEDQPLPWNISITYMLDGENISADELAGKSGNIQIQIETSANETVNPLFFEHFLLQISLTLDPMNFQDILAPKGIQANEGKNKQITYTVLPEKEEVLIVSARVTDLEMDPINISAIPANIAIDDPDISDMKGDIETLAGAIKDVDTGVSKLNDGITELNNGASDLSEGSTAYSSGVNELNQSSGGLIDGSKEIRSALGQISGAMQEAPDVNALDLDGLKQLPQGFRELAAQLRGFSEVLIPLNAAISEIPTAIDSDQIAVLYGALEENEIDSQALDQLVVSYEAAQAVKQINESIPGGLVENITQLAAGLEESAKGIEEGMANMDQLGDITNLVEGLTTLSSEYETFHQGLETYTSGVSSLTSSYGELDAGIKGVSSGTSSLKNGVNELHKGTKELKVETSDLPNEMELQIEEFMAEYDFSNFEPASFISDENESIGVVQFVLQTESIEIEEVETDEEVVEDKRNLWDRFIDLFKGN